MTHLFSFLLALFYFAPVNSMPLNDIPKYDMAISSTMLFIGYNNEVEHDTIWADKTFKGKALLVRGWYGGAAWLPDESNKRQGPHSIAIEVISGSNHETNEFVIAQFDDIEPLIKAHKSIDDIIVVLCKGNGFIRNDAIIKNDKIRQPLLNKCVLIK